MTQEQFDRYLEQTFDSFSKTLIRNEGINALEEIKTRAKHEVPFDMLSREEFEQISSTDSYLINGTILRTKELSIPINDPALSKVLQFLPPQRREIVLLSFFMDYSDAEIGRKLGITANAVRYRKKIALSKLKELLNEQETNSG